MGGETRGKGGHKGQCRKEGLGSKHKSMWGKMGTTTELMKEPETGPNDVGRGEKNKNEFAFAGGACRWRLLEKWLKLRGIFKKGW